jgi:hypothetical protein
MSKRAMIALVLAAVFFASAADASASPSGSSPAKSASAKSSPKHGPRPAKNASPRPALPPPDAKTVTAVRLAEPVVLDGRLDEAVWKATPPATGFTQNDPEDGSPATEPTDVWVAYDDHALYVAAFCHDSDPAKIRKRLGRRDAQTDSDWFMVAIDPYYDRRSGYAFYANPAGAITDAALSNDVNDDDSWDGVWENKAQVNSGGWTIEIRIPFNQIRFPKKDAYTWGVNFKRMLRRRNEQSSFNWSPKTEVANVSRFARLEGLRGISPGGRVEFVPYVVTQAQFRPAEAGNPFETGHRALGNAGFDLKVGLRSNLTLDATVNPDFGQVEVDPAVLNLSAYETYYQEKRPFFIEGASLFNNFGRGGIFINANINWPQPTFFYSRRIGREPQGYVTEDGYTRMPDRTTILGAAKLTGKLGGSWNVGFLNAVTGREFAQIASADMFSIRTTQEVEPLTYYGALRVQKDIDEGRRGIGIMATGVVRDLAGGNSGSETLAGILNKDALSFGIDGWTTLDKKKQWVVGGWAGATRVDGSAEDILRLQTSSMHYFQRPDATHVEVEPARTSLSGWAARFNLVKQQGHLLVLASAGAISPGFDPNDVGFQYGASDIINVQFLPGYQWTKPGKLFLNALVVGGWFRNYDFGGNRTWDGGLVEFNGQFRNFWMFDTMFAFNPDTMSNNRTRGGPLSLTPSGWQVNLMVTSDSRKPVVFEFQGTTYQRPRGDKEWNLELAARWKPASNINLSVGPMFGSEINDVQWVRHVDDALMTSTYGARYVFGRIDQKVLGSEIRLDWTFTPRLTLQAYVQPYVAVGHYGVFKELAAPRTFDYNVYGGGAWSGGAGLGDGTNGSTISYDAASDAYTVDPDGPAGAAAPFMFGNPDFNYKSLRGTIVLRWEYRAGSLLYFVWTQNRSDFANPGNMRLGRDLGDLFSAPGDNIFLLKVSYRWNI